MSKENTSTENVLLGCDPHCIARYAPKENASPWMRIFQCNVGRVASPCTRPSWLRCTSEDELREPTSCLSSREPASGPLRRALPAPEPAAPPPSLVSLAHSMGGAELHRTQKHRVPGRPARRLLHHAQLFEGARRYLRVLDLNCGKRCHRFLRQPMSGASVGTA